ncbi:selenocysteine-specific translation elongation factor [Thermodesulfobacteriota bacterium]
MTPIILGTAGHIDHGKTSLIKAVTGIDTDRLKEEKKRGITIELGFASLDLPGGQRLGIVDVPGHEKFVKNMVAGATGIDMVAMVIAADEGVMPQTREHMEICTLLGIEHGLVVLTKTDMVDAEWLELVKEDIQSYMQGTFLEEAPVVPVSSATGDGLPEFVDTLHTLCAEIDARQPGGIFRLPIDRVFTMKGFGTVITGTLVSGQVNVGDSVMIYPTEITSKVRGIQVHSQSAESASAGMRTAINFQGIEKTAVERGEVVALPGTLKANYMVDGTFDYLAANKKPIKNRSRIRFHAGTSEVLGNLVLLEADELAPGDTGLVQVRLESPICLIKDDRFVIRSYSPIRTIGGGQVLNPIPLKHRRFKNDILSGLKSLAGGEPQDVVAYAIDASGYRGTSLAELKIMANISDKQIHQTLQNLLSHRTAVQVDKENQIYMHQNSFDKLQATLLSSLEAYHHAFPLKTGMPKEELKSKLPPPVNARIYNLLLNQVVKSEAIVQTEDTVRLSSHSVSLGADQSDIRKKIITAYLGSDLTPPYFKELCKTLKLDLGPAKDVLMLLLKEGVMVKAKEELFFHQEAIDRLKGKLIDFFAAHDELTTPQFKEMTGVSRKYLIPLLEYFDAQNVTIRVGDVRKLRGK